MCVYTHTHTHTHTHNIASYPFFSGEFSSYYINIGVKQISRLFLTYKLETVPIKQQASFSFPLPQPLETTMHPPVSMSLNFR